MLNTIRSDDFTPEFGRKSQYSTVGWNKGLINDDDPRTVGAMGQQLAMFPLALGAGMGATLFRPLAGFYAMIAVILALRLWQRRWLRRQPTIPARKPSSS